MKSLFEIFFTRPKLMFDREKNTTKIIFEGDILFTPTSLQLELLIIRNETSSTEEFEFTRFDRMGKHI